MMARVVLYAAALWGLASSEEDALEPRVARSVYEPYVVEAADFVVDELRKLSDSGVYTTLTLVRSSLESLRPRPP